VIVNDFEEGWDLVLLDQDFKEKERLEGLNDQPPGYYKVIKTRTSGDDNYILWLRGQSEISVVNTLDFSARHINNFWNYRGKDMKAQVAALDTNATKLVGIGFDMAENLQTIHVYDGGDGVAIFEGYDVIPEGKAIFKSSRRLALFGDFDRWGCVLHGRSPREELRVRRCLFGGDDFGR
jgi:hypothetical protein